MKVRIYRSLLLMGILSVELYRFLREKRVGYIEGKIDIQKHLDISLYREALESLLKEEPNDPTWLKFKADYEKNDGKW